MKKCDLCNTFLTFFLFGLRCCCFSCKSGTHQSATGSGCKKMFCKINSAPDDSPWQRDQGSGRGWLCHALLSSPSHNCATALYSSFSSEVPSAEISEQPLAEAFSLLPSFPTIRTCFSSSPPFPPCSAGTLSYLSELPFGAFSQSSTCHKGPWKDALLEKEEAHHFLS